MTERVEGAPDPEVRAYRPPRRYTAAYKQRILDEYERLDKQGKGALLRREGLYNPAAAIRLRADGLGTTSTTSSVASTAAPTTSTTSCRSLATCTNGSSTLGGRTTDVDAR